MLARMNDEMCEVMCEFFSLLAHPNRIRMFCALQHGPQTVSALAEQSQISLPNASQHLRVMRQNGALTHVKRGQQVFYQIADPRFIQAAEIIRDTLLEKVQGHARRTAQGTVYRKNPRPQAQLARPATFSMATKAHNLQNRNNVIPLFKKEFSL